MFFTCSGLKYRLLYDFDKNKFYHFGQVIFDRFSNFIIGFMVLVVMVGNHMMRLESQW